MFNNSHFIGRNGSYKFCLCTIRIAPTSTHRVVVVPIGSLIALGFAFVFYKSVMRQNEGTEVMQGIAQSVREGARAYLRQQYKVVGIVFAVLCVIFIIMAFGLNAQNQVVPFAF